MKGSFCDKRKVSYNKKISLYTKQKLSYFYRRLSGFKALVGISILAKIKPSPIEGASPFKELESYGDLKHYMTRSNMSQVNQKVYCLFFMPE